MSNPKRTEMTALAEKGESDKSFLFHKEKVCLAFPSVPHYRCQAKVLFGIADCWAWELSVFKLSDTAAAAAAKSLQSCPTLCDPTDGSPPGSPSLGFSRQEHWSGLPSPSPVHESEKWKWSESEVAQSCPTERPHGLQPTRLLHPWDFPGKSTGVGCYSFSILYIVLCICQLQSPNISLPLTYPVVTMFVFYIRASTSVL